MLSVIDVCVYKATGIDSAFCVIILQYSVLQCYYKAYEGIRVIMWVVVYRKIIALNSSKVLI
jgi:hypothetical protein